MANSDPGPADQLSRGVGPPERGRPPSSGTREFSLSSAAKPGPRTEEMCVRLQAHRSKPGKHGRVFLSGVWFDMSASSLFCTGGVKRPP